MKISAREKRVLIIGGGICAAILGWYAATALLPSGADLARDVELSKRRLLKQKETLQQEETFRARVTEYEERIKQNMARLLPENNPSLASAELQKVLTNMAAQAGVEITQKNIQKEQRLQNDLVKVAVRIETNCNAQQLVQFLAAIESYEKYLFLDELVINGYRIQRRYEIKPSMTVAGIISSPEPKAEDKPGEAK